MMTKPRQPGPDTAVVLYARSDDALARCREAAVRRGWRIVAAEVDTDDDAAVWERALRQLLEHRAHVLMVPDQDTVAGTAQVRNERLHDVSIHYARVFYADTRPERLVRHMTVERQPDEWQ